MGPRQIDLPKLPAKRMSVFGGSLSEKQIEERRLKLEEYMQLVVQQLNWSMDETLRGFLECDTFLKPRKPKDKTNKEATAAG